jgi:hypothetical protein
MNETMRSVIGCLNHKRFPLEDEKRTQSAIFEALKKELGPIGDRLIWARVQREVRIAGGIIDFMVDDIGIEVKLKGQAAAIVRQLRGYAREPALNGIVLVTSRPMTMEMIGGKPVAIVDMARAWL